MTAEADNRPRQALKELRYIARLRQNRELLVVRSMLEDLVRAAYPRLANKCLCARCLTVELQSGAGRSKR